MRVLPRLRSILLPAALIALTAQGASADLTSVSGFNLITSGNDNGEQSDVQGRVLIGGTLNVNNFTFGGQLAGSGIGTSGTNGVFNVLGTGVTNPNNNSIANAYYATNNSGGTLSHASQNTSLVSGYTNNLSSFLTGLSTSYGNLTTNSTTTVNNSNGTVTFAATPGTINGKSVAVFSVDQSVFTHQNESFSLSGGNSSTTYIINVTGSATGITFDGGLQVSSLVNQYDSANILFNFENATSLTNIPNLGGSILAPNADLNTGNSLTGGVYVNSITNVGEIDLAQTNSSTRVAGFTGYAPSAVPEPASIASTMAGLAIVAGVAWRRRRRLA